MASMGRLYWSFQVLMCSTPRSRAYRTVRYALDRGVEHIKTWNDVNNQPMLAINVAMGFERQPAWITVEKDLSGPSQSASSS